jgi:hypothetical protein
MRKCHAVLRERVLFALALAIGAFSAEAADAVREPLAPRIDSESAAAARGDSVAAARLFNDAAECLAVQRIDARLAIQQTDKHSAINDPAAWHGEAPQVLKRMDSARQRADRSLDMCAGTAGKITNETIYGMALTAAKLGDKAAIACFLSAPWGVNSKDVDPVKALQYRQEAKVLKSHGIEKGDWRIVQAMIVAASDTLPYGYAVFTQESDDVARLRYFKLLRLGTPAGTEEAKNLDGSVEIMSSRVPPDAVPQADEWARTMYSKYYAAIPPNTRFLPCDA